MAGFAWGQFYSAKRQGLRPVKPPVPKKKVVHRRAGGPGRSPERQSSPLNAFSHAAVTGAAAGADGCFEAATAFCFFFFSAPVTFFFSVSVPFFASAPSGFFASGFVAVVTSWGVASWVVHELIVQPAASARGLVTHLDRAGEFLLQGFHGRDELSQRTFDPLFLNLFSVLVENTDQGDCIKIRNSKFEARNPKQIPKKSNNKSQTLSL